MIQYYLRINQNTMGPFTGSELRDMVAQGRLSPDHMVSIDRNQWIPLKNIKGLFTPVSNPRNASGNVPVSEDRPTAIPAFPVFGAGAGLSLQALWIVFVLLAVSMMATWTAAMQIDSQYEEYGVPGEYEEYSLPEEDVDVATAVTVLCVIFTLLVFMIYGLLWLISFYRCWRWVHRWTHADGDCPTPGKAVGYLFIPLYGLYWMFPALRGLGARLAKRLKAVPPSDNLPPTTEAAWLGTATAVVVLGMGFIGIWSVPIVTVLSFLYMQSAVKAVNRCIRAGQQ